MFYEKPKPFDVQIVLGEDDSGQEIGRLDAYFQLKQANILRFCEKAGIKEQVNEDCILRFDFTVKEGREKECIEYFENGLDTDQVGEYLHDLSPLQNWFHRPKRSGKLQLFENGKGCVTLEYVFYKEAIEEEQDLVQIGQKLKESSFHPDIKVSAIFNGYAETYKKNRVRLIVDHIKFHLTSEEFKTKDFQNLLILLQVFSDGDEDLEQIVNNPIFKFVEHCEQIQIKLRMASIRKLLYLYEIGIGQSNTIKERKSEYPQVIKGLFKDQLTVTMVYSDKVGMKATYKYQSEAVLIRMLTGMKKYLKYFD